MNARRESPWSLLVSDEHACSYLPGRQACMAFTFANRMQPAAFEQLLNRGFRRSGRMFYRPACSGCHECQPIRVLTREFQPDRSMRRTWRTNHDLTVTVRQPNLTQGKVDLYRCYLAARHEKEDSGGLREFLYDSPVATREIEFHLGSELVCVAIADQVPSGLSAVYSFFDPDRPSRGLGTYAVLWQIDYCRQQDWSHLYLGYYVRDCRKMSYKNRFAPHEILSPDGLWRRPEC